MKHIMTMHRALDVPFFLPILLACKRTAQLYKHAHIFNGYLEARVSLYASITLTFHGPRRRPCVSATIPLFSIISTPISYLLISAALRYTTLAPIANFSYQNPRPLGRPMYEALEPCAFRGSKGGDNGHEIHVGDLDVMAWWQVRKYWILSTVRGMLARCLVLQLPRKEVMQRYPEWMRRYNYPLKGSDNQSENIPFLQLERYGALPLCDCVKTAALSSV
ncbi:hypothetical protein F4804DRAFT_213790 [Jackrogersella minutella]|nr:hypothetical protein F4804DRAFT_213790 [Jackrogersella minutella]